jgi:hypothetical protein
LRIDGEIEGHPYILEQTQTLLQVDADKVVISRKGTMRIQGREVPANKDRDEIRRKDEHALKIEREGDEEIPLPNGWTECHWIDARDSRTNATVRFWLAKGVPGGIAKGEIREGTGAAATRISLMSWERK